MITRRSAEVVFDGLGARVGPLTWGQQSSWDSLRAWRAEGKAFFVLTRWLPVPLLLRLEDVLDLLGELMARHESLRTLYRAGAAGDGVQEVRGTGSVAVEVFDRPADDAVEFSAIVTDCLRRAEATVFDHERELPLRVSIATHEGIPVLVVLGVSHMAADFVSTEVLARELGALLRARADGTPPPPAGSALQPIDLAHAENSPDGQLRTVEAMRHLRQQLDRLPPGLLPPRAEPASPRFHRGELESDAIPVALRLAARRHRSTTSVLLLAITTALVRCVTPGPVYPLDVMQGNRAEPALLTTVTSLNQAVRTAVDTTADTFEELLAQSAAVMAAARRHSRYDGRAAREVTRSAVARRGAEFEPGCQFNDMWSTLPPAGRRAATPAELDRLAEASAFAWPQRSEHEGSALFVDTRGTPDRIRVSLMADTALLPPADIRAFLLTVERVAIALAEGPVPPARVAEMVDEHRVRAGHRG